jgi:hypothetical protein
MPQVIEQPVVTPPESTGPSSVPSSEFRVPHSIFLPLIDNGQGDIKANFLMCILRAFKGYNLAIERFSDSLAPRARNRAVAYFLNNDVCKDRDYLMFIDSDILFEKDHIDMLMESDAPILAGLYCKKEKGIAPCLNTLPGHVETKVGGYVEIAGTGFLRIHRKVFEKMRPGMAAHYTNHGNDEWDFFPVGVVNNEYLSEDWYFCDKARQLGFKIMLDSRIQLRHEGVAIYPLEETIKKHMDNGGGKTTVDEVAA